MDENIATIGMTEFAAKVLGEILYLELPEEGDRTFAETPFGSVESIHGFMELTGLVSGVVVEVNPSVLEAPFAINDDPYHRGWLMKVEMENENDLASLMKKEAYQNWLMQRQTQNLGSLTSHQISEILSL